MTGILLLIVIAIWGAIVVWLAKMITKKLPKTWWHNLIDILVCMVLLPLPLIDEIVGARQFEQLCKDNSTIQVDRATAVGKTVYFVPQPDVEVKGTWVRIVLKTHLFIDAATGENVVSYNTLIAEGGRFIRSLGIFEGGMPLTFRGTCVPNANIKNLFKSLEITALDRPQTNIRGN